MINYFKEIFSGLYSLLVGMKLTAKYAMSPTITAHYPYQTVPISPNFRGHIDLVLNPKNGKHKCISCMMCQRECPSGCIEIKAEKPEGAKKKELVAYHFDFTKCSLCANCVEVCPTSALDFSDEYNLAGSRREDFHFELVGRLRDKAEAFGLTEGIEPEVAEAKPEETKPEQPDVG